MHERKACLVCCHCHKTTSPTIEGYGSEFWCRAPVPPWALGSIVALRGLGFALHEDYATACKLFSPSNMAVSRR